MRKIWTNDIWGHLGLLSDKGNWLKKDRSAMPHTTPGGTHMKIRAEIRGWFHSLVLRLALAALLCIAFTNTSVLAANCNTTALNALGVPNMTIASATDILAAAPNPVYCDVKGSVAT